MTSDSNAYRRSCQYRLTFLERVNKYYHHQCRCRACRAAARKYQKEGGNGGYTRDYCSCGNLKYPSAKLCIDCHLFVRRARRKARDIHNIDIDRSYKEMMLEIAVGGPVIDKLANGIYTVLVTNGQTDYWQAWVHNNL